MSNISYIRILQAIESFASAHLQVKKFGSDFPSQMPNFATEDEAYPILFVSPTASIFDENTNTFQIDVYCFDIIQKDRNNINTILSDTNQILNDLDKWLKDGDIAGIDIVTTSTALPLNNALLDYAAGWQMSMVLTTDTYGICEIPFSEVPVVTTEVNNIIYQSFLTCENLASCETFEGAVNNLQNQINNLSGGTDFDCAALSGCTVIQDINSELSGLTSQINEVSATTESIQENYVPYIGATQDVNLGYNAFRNNNGLLVSWENGGAQFGWEFIGDAKQMYFADSDTSGNFNYSGQSIDFICNLEEGWGTTNWGYDFNDGTYLSSTIYNTIGGAGLNTQRGNNNVSQITTSAGDTILSNLTDNAGPLFQSYIRLWKDYTQLLITNNDTSEANAIEMYTDRTYTKKYITTDEGFEGDYLQLNTAAAEASAVGKLKWNDTDGTVDLGLKGGNVTLQLGQENVVRVVNKTGADLLESQFRVVRVRSVAEGGAQGQRLAVKLAQADSDTDSATTLGVVTENIGNNQEGFITVFGQVKGINTTGAMSYGGTETWVDGDMLYLSPTNPGYLTKVKPVAPQHMVVVGYVEYAHSQNGKIFVKVDNGYELDELHNVKISAATSGDVLTYNSSTQVWENKTLNEITGTYNVKITTPSSIVSGTTSEVQLLKLEIPPYSFGPNDVLNIPNLIISKVGTIASYTLRVKISTSSTMPIGTGTDTIAFMSIGNTNTLTKMYRNYFISGGFLRGVGTINSASDVVNSTTALLVKAFDYTTTNYLYVSVNPASASDTFQLVGLQINNI